MTCWRSSGGVAAAAYMLIGARARQGDVDDDVHLRLLRHLRGAPAGRVPGRGAGPRRLPAAAVGAAAAGHATAQLMGHSVFNHLLATTKPVVVSLALLLEVPGAALLAALILGQVPPLGAAVGLVVILAGMALVIVNNRAPVVDQAPRRLRPIPRVAGVPAGETRQ